MTYVRPVLEYANPILSLAIATSLKRLDNIQNVSMRLMTRGLRSIPIAVNEAETGCEPLALRRQGQALMARE